VEEVVGGGGCVRGGLERLEIVFFLNRWVLVYVERPR